MIGQNSIEFTLRPATADDIDFIFQLRDKTMKPSFKDTLGWDDAEEYEKAADELDHTKIVMHGQEKIGLIKIIPRTDELHLHQMQILPEFQGKGIGLELIRQAILQSNKMQKPITLFVVINTPAKSLYERFGFTVTGDYVHNCKMCRLPK